MLHETSLYIFTDHCSQSILKKGGLTISNLRKIPVNGVFWAKKNRPFAGAVFLSVK
jgi:hypothetical protein